MAESNLFYHPNRKNVSSMFQPEVNSKKLEKPKDIVLIIKELLRIINVDPAPTYRSSSNFIYASRETQGG